MSWDSGSSLAPSEPNGSYMKRPKSYGSYGDVMDLRMLASKSMFSLNLSCLNLSSASHLYLSWKWSWSGHGLPQHQAHQVPWKFLLERHSSLVFRVLQLIIVLSDLGRWSAKIKLNLIGSWCFILFSSLRLFFLWVNEWITLSWTETFIRGCPELTSSSLTK